MNLCLLIKLETISSEKDLFSLLPHFVLVSVSPESMQQIE